MSNVDILKGFALLGLGEHSKQIVTGSYTDMYTFEQCSAYEYSEKVTTSDNTYGKE